MKNMYILNAGFRFRFFRFTQYLRYQTQFLLEI